MNYCILRAVKLTSFGSIAGSAKHTFREIPTPNADASRTHLNRTFGAQNAAAVRAAIEARLPAKRRRDAVLAIEYLVTASPEWFRTTPVQQQNAYFAAAVRWLEARHGKANIVCVNVQLDETSQLRSGTSSRPRRASEFSCRGRLVEAGRGGGARRIERSAGTAGSDP
jgi:hypothetical protein